NQRRSLTPLRKVYPDDAQRTLKTGTQPVLRSRRQEIRVSLQLWAVVKRCGDTTVMSDVSLRVGRGQKVALIGPNGSGKTTLLRIAAEVLAPDFGSVTAEGRVAYLEQSATAGEHDLLAALTPPELRSATTELTAAQAALEDP